MADEEGWIESAVDAGRRVAETFTTVLGIERERFVCPDCGTACNPTFAYDVNRAAFDGGESPAWVCPDCDRKFVREDGVDAHTLDPYGRE